MLNETKVGYWKAYNSNRVATKRQFMIEQINRSQELPPSLSNNHLIFKSLYMWNMLLYQNIRMKISFYAIEMSFYTTFTLLRLQICIKKPFKFASSFQVFEIHR